jgi:predicted SprT family Zn-dependent metalloprotease
MIIEGNARFIPDSEFRPKIQQALDLLKSKSSADYILVSAVVEKIRASAISGADYQDTIIRIARPTFETSLTWLASVIVHESFHIAMFMAGKNPAGQGAEIKCNITQLYTLRCLNAPQNEISYLLSQKGDHADINGDGKYDIKDYLLRKH